MLLQNPESPAASPRGGMDARTQPPRLRLEFLDGIRALAALWVVLAHVLIRLFQSYPRDVPAWSFTWLFYVHLAVDTFIVLSGFCLILPVARRGNLEGGARAFYARRARRILPPYYAALAITTLIGLLFHGLSPRGGLVSLKSLAINVLLVQDIFHWGPEFNLPTWTVALEWKIYFLLPVMVWLLHRYHAAVMLALAAALGAVLTVAYSLLLPPSPLGLSLNCPWYVFLFATGVCGGAVAARTERPAGPASAWLIGALGLAGTIRLYTHPLNAVATMPLCDAAFGVFMAAALVLLGSRRPASAVMPVLRLFSWRPLVFLGTFSYSLYLVHYPLITIMYWVLTPTHFLSNTLAPLRQAASHFSFMFGFWVLIGIPVIIGTAYLFFLVFERPYLSTRKRETMTDLARDAALSPAP
ncbi:MAG: acyltransferase [Armatimonadetes bacterium]|nr:acyltransferase [Armatimonadota bacterium]